MRDFFEGIQTIFEDYLFIPFNALAETELGSWWLANILNFIFILIAMAAFIFWMLQLKKFKDNNEERRDSTAHTYLG